MVLSNPVLEVIRRELKRLSPDVRIDLEQIKSVLVQDVLKREVVEGEKADEARKKIHKVASKLLRARKAKPSSASEPEPEVKEEETSSDNENDEP
jgi:hypothetical protein